MDRHGGVAGSTKTQGMSPPELVLGSDTVTFYPTASSLGSWTSTFTLELPWGGGVSLLWKLRTNKVAALRVKPNEGMLMPGSRVDIQLYATSGAEGVKVQVRSGRQFRGLR
jgi:hypothetical protein